MQCVTGLDCEYVFGYGSLVGSYGPRGTAADQLAPGVAHVAGFRRQWNVAMNNCVDLPGYKHYLDESGSRPAVYVSFLNLVPAVASEHVNGVLFPVTEADMPELDARERNYRRIDVTAQMVGAPAGRVWTYVGSEAAERRFRVGNARGRAVISRAYYDAVLCGFDGLGDGAADEFRATTDDPECPIVVLERVDVEQSVV